MGYFLQEEPVSRNCLMVAISLLIILLIIIYVLKVKYAP